VADDAEQVAVPLAVRDLVDPDPAQARQTVAGAALVLVDDPFQHPSDGRPVDSHQPRHDRLRRIAHEPDAAVLEGAREATARPRERQLLGHHPAARAVEPAHLEAQQAGRAQHVQVTQRPQRAVVARTRRKAAARAAKPPPRRARQLDQHPLLTHLTLQLNRHHPHALQAQEPLE
jgi:hypothetical protein